MKKGESALTFVFSLIFLAVILSIFYVLFLLSSANRTNYVINEVNLGNVNINLINYLRTPITDNKKIFDLILESYYINNYEDLEKITNNIFNKIYNADKCPLWRITGEINNERFFDYESEFDIKKYTLNPGPRNIIHIFTDKSLITRTSSLNLIIPDPNKKLKITLKEGCINE